MAIRINDREDNAVKIQQTLTAHGCKIMMRLGLHDQEEGGVCSPSGTMILQLRCSAEECKAIEADLTKIDGVKAKFLDLD
jgi:hypothetical protein